MAFIAKVSGCT